MFNPVDGTKFTFLTVFIKLNGRGIQLVVNNVNSANVIELLSCKI